MLKIQTKINLLYGLFHFKIKLSHTFYRYIISIANQQSEFYIHNPYLVYL